MSEEHPDFSTMIEQRLAALGTNAYAVEQAADLPPDAIRNVLRSSKKDGPTISRAKEICDALGLEFYIGRKRSPLGFAEGNGAPEFSPKGGPPGGFIAIPWHLSANQRGSSPFGLSLLWLQSEGLIPDFLQAVIPDVVHISYAIPKKTVAVLEVNANRRGTGTFWCYTKGGLICIARAAFSGDTVVLLPKDETEDVLVFSGQDRSQIRLLGRVAWMGMALDR